MMENITLSHYDIIFDDSLEAVSDFLQQHQYSRVFVLVDHNTSYHCLPLLKAVYADVEVIEVRCGEEFKNLQTCETIWQHLLQHNADRKAIFINLGGGVPGDMGGFAASCYKRGIDFINIPTTVLSQVDSSIGGKLGIDFHYGKNLIGLFRDPKAVFISSRFFETLPKQHFINGWAEIFKHALIRDKSQWEHYKQLDLHRLSHHEMNAIVRRSLLIKKEVVEEDPFENGLRKILNFGHTIGHAIETYSLEHEEDSLLHGEAIAIGMICEAHISVKEAGLHIEDFLAIKEVLLRYFPKHDISRFDTEKLLDIMSIDKKNKGSVIMASLLSGIGNCIYDQPLRKEEILDSLRHYIGH